MQHKNSSQLVTRNYVSLALLVDHHLHAIEHVVAANTRAAKQRDLRLFLNFYQLANGRDDAHQWLSRDTGAFRKALVDARRSDGAPAWSARSVNRVLATLRTFARWTHEESGTPFPHGLPTRGVKDLDVDDFGFRGLAAIDLNRIMKAADLQAHIRVNADGRPQKLARPLRDRSIIYLLRWCGLRETELAALDRAQYVGKYLRRVQCKGSKVRDVFVPAEAREVLDDYLARERVIDDPDNTLAPLLLLPARHGKTAPTGGRVSRFLIYRVVRRVAGQANQALPAEQRINLSPHTLRHVRGNTLTQAGGHLGNVADALGHASVRYAARYARRPLDETEALLEKG